MVIGITGGIASGKSTVSNILKGMGIPVIDADKIGHEVLRLPDTINLLTDVFGLSVFDRDGNIDRAKLASEVFPDKDKLSQLNSIIHPRIINVLKDEIRKCLKKSEVIAVEIPLLYECNLEYLCDIICVVYSDIEARVQRLRIKGMSESDIAARIKSQMSLEEKIKLADIVIYNLYGMEELKKEIFQKFSNYIK